MPSPMHRQTPLACANQSRPACAVRPQGRTHSSNRHAGACLYGGMHRARWGCSSAAGWAERRPARGASPAGQGCCRRWHLLGAWTQGGHGVWCTYATQGLVDGGLWPACHRHAARAHCCRAPPACLAAAVMAQEQILRTGKKQINEQNAGLERVHRLAVENTAMATAVRADLFRV